MILADYQIQIIIPLKIYCLDDKTQCRADSSDIFVHNLLNDGGLPGIVQTSVAMAISESLRKLYVSRGKTYSIRIRISLSFSRAFLKLDNIFTGLLVMLQFVVGVIEGERKIGQTRSSI